MVEKTYTPGVTRNLAKTRISSKFESIFGFSGILQIKNMLDFEHTIKILRKYFFSALEKSQRSYTPNIKSLRAREMVEKTYTPGVTRDLSFEHVWSQNIECGI